MLDVAYALLAQEADARDRAAAQVGIASTARADLDGVLGLAPTDLDDTGEVGGTDVISLAAWVERANRAL